MNALRRIFLLVALAGAAAGVHAATDPCFPPKPANEDHLVFQYTRFLSPQEAAQLDGKLVQFARETSNRIAVVAVDTLCGYPPSEFAFQLGEAWGLGKRGIDNGVLVLVKPNGRAGDRHVFIAVGYGLEGAIPDLVAKRIVDEEVLPRFREGDYYGGMDKATDVLMGMAKGEIDAKSYGEEEPISGVSVLWILAILGFFLFIFVSAALRVRRYARVNHMDFWAAWMLMNAASSSHGGSWRGFSGGGGSGFGGGGGGFGGFGGGSFGGGGAGGSW